MERTLGAMAAESSGTVAASDHLDKFSTIGYRKQALRAAFANKVLPGGQRWGRSKPLPTYGSSLVKTIIVVYYRTSSTWYTCFLGPPSGAASNSLRWFDVASALSFRAHD